MAKQVRQARHWQRKDSPVRSLVQLGKGGIKRDLKASLKHLGGLVDALKAEALIRAGLYSRVHEAVDLQHYREVLKAPFAKIGRLRSAGAQLGVRKINGAFAQRRQRVRFHKPGTVVYLDHFRKDIGDRFNFDLYDEATQARLRAAQDELIQQIDANTRDTIFTVVVDGAQAGLSPDAIVGDIRAMIGLTDTQAQAVMNYESMLRDLDPDALVRQLRNADYDAVVQDAIDSGEDLSDVAIDNMVQDYLDNYLDYRAGTIAQTEAQRAVNAGIQDAYQQAIDRGALPGDAVTQYWQVALDEKTCAICLSIPDMNPDGVSIGEPFQSVDGEQDAPPDPHPNCRCSIEVVTDLDKVPDTEDAFAAEETA